MMLLLGRTAAGHAQDDGESDATPPTPDAGVIFQHNALVFFPYVLQFNVNLATRSENITGGSLTVFQPGGFQQEFPFNIDTDIAGQELDTVQISKNITFDLENAPLPFVPVNYRWHLITDNERISEIADEIIFEDQRVTWQENGDPPLSFRWHGNGGINILRDDLLNIYELLRQHTRLNLNFQFLIYGSDVGVCQTDTSAETGESVSFLPGRPDIPCVPDEIESFYARHGYMLIQRQDNDFVALQHQLIDRMVSRFYEPVSARTPE
ncbi:MAG TPA: hypothetical protein VJZ27_07565, partial [Aggregatilineales bacterium]|nr:hypothetical protein [Aggregatilineales bacterium]